MSKRFSFTKKPSPPEPTAVPESEPAPAAEPTPKTPADRVGGPMDPQLLEQLVRLMAANDLSALDLRDGEQRITLNRGPQQVAYAPPQPPTTMPTAPAPTPSAPQPASTPAAPADESAGLVAIKSPMVGTFYARPSPDAKAFVSVGTAVDEDTDVCVIEAMKVFNNIKAETKGTVAKIVAEDGKPVEFGQVLFLVKP